MRYGQLRLTEEEAGSFVSGQLEDALAKLRTAGFSDVTASVLTAGGRSIIQITGVRLGQPLRIRYLTNTPGVTRSGLRALIEERVERSIRHLPGD